MNDIKRLNQKDGDHFNQLPDESIPGKKVEAKFRNIRALSANPDLPPIWLETFGLTGVPKAGSFEMNGANFYYTDQLGVRRLLSGVDIENGETPSVVVESDKRMIISTLFEDTKRLLRASSETEPISPVNLYRTPEMVAVEFATAVAVGDGQFYLRIPDELANWKVTEARAWVITAGTTNATEIDIYSLTQSHSILTDKISIASGDKDGSGTIDSDYAIIAAQEELRFDVDQISTTAPKGLILQLTLEPNPLKIIFGDEYTKLLTEDMAEWAAIWENTLGYGGLSLNPSFGAILETNCAAIGQIFFGSCDDSIKNASIGLWGNNDWAALEHLGFRLQIDSVLQAEVFATQSDGITRTEQSLGTFDFGVGIRKVAGVAMMKDGVATFRFKVGDSLIQTASFNVQTAYVFASARHGLGVAYGQTGAGAASETRVISGMTSCDVI